MMGFLRVFLFPFAFLYGLGVRFRNFLYDTGILPSREYGIALINVGNLSVGGTGKTPHVEWLLDVLIKNGHRPAVLSRGYKRKSKGYHEADALPDSRKVGDEAAQIKARYPDIVVAVSKDRGKGIRNIREKHEGEVDVILLDDAFQHRKVHAGLNLLLTSYERPYMKDQLLPVGRLREPRSGVKRAEILIVSKCPRDMRPLDRRVMMYELTTLEQQQVYFSYIEYGKPYPVFRSSEPIEFTAEHYYIVLTGIADPSPLYEELRSRQFRFEAVKRPDHHEFTPRDHRVLLKKVEEKNEEGEAPIILSTEKDASRLVGSKLSDKFAELPVHAIPMKVRIHGEEETEKLAQRALKHVREDQRNDRIHPEQVQADT